MSDDFVSKMAGEKNRMPAAKLNESSMSLPLVFTKPWKPPNKKLFDKLVSYFPDQDENLIKNLMYKHKEVEHEIISALVETCKPGQAGAAGFSGLTGSKGRAADLSELDNNGAIMKLRYLKYLFPTCDEIDLYHLLYCNDLDIQRVIVEVEKRGHKKANINEVLKNRKSQSQVLKAQKTASKVKTPTFDSLATHKRRTKPVVTGARADNLRDNLNKKFEHVPDALLFKALEAADYNEALATRFLQEMIPVDDELYKQRYEIQLDKGPDVVLFPSKGVQKGGGNFMPITSTDHVAIAREVVECDHALALLKVDACTFTQDDFDLPRFTHAKGRQESLATGSLFRIHHDSMREKSSPRIGPNEDLRNGPKYIRDEFKKLATGRNTMLSRGSDNALRLGPNSSLIIRTHPFFVEPKKSLIVNAPTG